MSAPAITSAKCPKCAAEAARAGTATLFFVCFTDHLGHARQFDAGLFDCPTHGRFAVLDNPPAPLPGRPGASDLEQNTFVATCPWCRSDRAAITAVVNIAGEPPFGGVACACPKCARNWLVADTTATIR